MIVGSVVLRPCADKQRLIGRTALPVPTTTVVPLVRCIRRRSTQIGVHSAVKGEVYPQPQPQNG